MIMDNVITIAIPVYNVEKYIEKSLLSALNQNFAFSYEILIIDDCGSDKSMQIVNRILNEHERGSYARIIRHSTNLGLGPARNTAIENARGKYLFFLDSDDWISENCLSILYAKAEETKSDITVGSTLRVEEDSMREIGKNIYPNKTIETSAAGVYMVIHSPDMHIEVWNKLYLVEYLRTNKICCIHKIFEDYIFDFVARATASKITLCSDVTLYYNIRSNSILTKLKEKATDEAANTLSDIIRKMQILVLQKFKNVAYIYDLYFLRVIWVLENFSRYDFDEVQKNTINENLKGFCQWIPSHGCLKNPRNKYIYDRCLCNETLEHFSYINKKSCTFPLKLYFKIKKKLLVR